MRLMMSLPLACLAVCLISCTQREPARQPPGPAVVQQPDPGPDAVVIGTWVWSNQRHSLLDRRIPARLAEGTQAQSITFGADGRVRLMVQAEVVSDVVDRGGTWHFNPNSERSLAVTFDPDVEPPGPKSGVSGSHSIDLTLQRYADVWYIMRVIDTGYIMYFKQRP